MKLRTWLDIDRIIRNKTNGLTKMPSGILDINCFYDAIEIEYASEKINEAEAQNILTDWFSNWFDQTESVIRLDIDDSTIPVEFLAEETAIGTALGVLAWGANWTVLLPSTGIHRPPWRERTPQVLLPLLDHAVYGATWGILYRAMRSDRV